MTHPDIAVVAAAIADPRRARVLMALADGRALPAGRLAEEAGVAASTVSSHLSLLLERGLVTVVPQGRFRYYRLASAQVEEVLEALAQLAPQPPVTSLREHTRARALRSGRTCYGHLAGDLGVGLFARMLAAGWISGGDGLHHPGRGRDRLASAGHDVDYVLTARGAARLAAWQVPADALTLRVPLKYCVDWTEERHHLAGTLGTAIAARMFDAGWIARGRVPRSVRLTEDGQQQMSILTAEDEY